MRFLEGFQREIWDESSQEKFPRPHPKGDPLKQEDGLELLAKQQQKLLIYSKHSQGLYSVPFSWQGRKKDFDYDS